MVERWRIVIGSDGDGLAYKDALKADMKADSRVARVIDVGARAGKRTPYQSVAVAAARELMEGRADRALLICGSGLGVAMSVNKLPGIRAVTATDSSSVERSVVDNDAQVLCFGHLVIGIEMARRLAGEWLDYRFADGAANNVTAITAYRENADSRQGPPSLVSHGELHESSIAQ